jgi:hypothetical protein
MQKCRNGRWALPKMGAFEKRIEKKIGFINTMGRKGKKNFGVLGPLTSSHQGRLQ